MAATFDIDTVLPEGWRRGEEHDETEIECVFYGGEITSHFWKFDRSEPLLARNRDVVAATIPRIEGSTFPPPPPVADSPWRAPGSPDRGNFICLGVVVENIEMRKIGIARNSSPE